MDNDQIQESLLELINQVNKVVSLNCVILFGSRSRQDYTSHSDIDMIFVGDFKEKFINRSSVIFQNFDYSLGVGVDAFCYTPDEFKKLFYDGIVSILDAIDHGICLHGSEFFNEYLQKLNHFKSKGLKRTPPVWIIPEEMSLE